MRRATPCGQLPTAKPPNFYPRSPCGERRDVIAVITDAQSISIHALLAESDNTNLRRHRGNDDFYPRSPCGERRQAKQTYRAKISISIHALLAESDSKPKALKSRRIVFLSTLSLRRATISARREARESIDFYPRSPCGERPNTNLRRHRGNDDFYPRSPCGERLIFLLSP